MADQLRSSTWLLFLVVPALAGTLLWASQAIHAAPFGERASPVYSVATLRANLTRHPAAWEGRSVFVHAIAGNCIDWVAMHGSSCVEWSSDLMDTGAASAAEYLPLVKQRTPALLTLLRHLPLLEQLVSAPQAMYWGIPGIYRIKLLRMPCSSRGAPDCYRAQVLDAVP